MGCSAYGYISIGVTVSVRDVRKTVVRFNETTGEPYEKNVTLERYFVNEKDVTEILESDWDNLLDDSRKDSIGYNSDKYGGSGRLGYELRASDWGEDSIALNLYELAGLKTGVEDDLEIFLGFKPEVDTVFGVYLSC